MLYFRFFLHPRDSARINFSQAEEASSFLVGNFAGPGVGIWMPSFKVGFPTAAIVLMIQLPLSKDTFLVGDIFVHQSF